MKNLEKFGVQELTTVEQRELEGGWFWPVLAAAIVVEIIGDWANFKAGLSGSAPAPGLR